MDEIRNKQAPWVYRYGLQFPYGECQCGCGTKTAIAKKTRNDRGVEKGKPNRYTKNHANHPHAPRSQIDKGSLPPGTRAIALTQGKFAIVDEDDYEKLSRFLWFAQQSRNNSWYALRGMYVNGNRQYEHMHRAILDAPEGAQVDHIDGDGLNNLRSNLRLATGSQNRANSNISRKNSSGYKGVCWDKASNKWMAYSRRNGKRVHLGRFDNPEAAAAAYDNAAIETYGEYAKTNSMLSEVCSAKG